MSKNPHPDFATWYATVDLGNSPKTLSARASGMATLLRGLNFDGCRDLLNVVFEQPGWLDQPGVAVIRECFRKADPAFPASANDAELKLLAEMALAIALERPTSRLSAGEVATLLYAALSNGSRAFSSVTDLSRRARDVVRREAVALRSRSALPRKPTSYVPSLALRSCFEGIDNPAEPEQCRALMDKVATRVAAAIGQSAEKARLEREALEKHLKVQDEELDLLWWTSNSWSETRGTSFSDLDLATRCLVAAVEAANRTQFVPGPSSVRGLLEKVVAAGDGSLTIKKAVNSVDTKWFQSIQIPNVTSCTPLHLALDMRLESGKSTTWSAQWSAVTKIDANCGRQAIEISELFYHERLLLAAYGVQK